jgi:zinc transport system substrate-binding protein
MFTALKHLLVSLSACLLVILFTACSEPPAATAGKKPLAVATIFNYYDALRAIAGPDFQTAILLPPGTSPHDFAATPTDKSTVARATLLIRNGLGLDDWASRLATGNSHLTQLVFGDQLQAIETKEELLAGQKPEEKSAPNPHVWLDPMNQVKAAEMIRDALIKIDPAHKDAYTTRAAAYIADLQKLDADFQSAAKTFTHHEFVGFHSAYDYLARRYGLKQVAALQELGAQGMSIAQVQDVIKIIRERHVPVLFSETAFDSRQADVVVKATGVKLGTLQPLETYDKPDDTYVSLMRQNLEELKRTMQ